MRCATQSEPSDRRGGGDALAPEVLVSALYGDLLALSASALRRVRGAETLQPAALVHEVFLKLRRARAICWESRGHFLAVAAKAMRQILADRAERRRTLKRGGGRAQRPLADVGTSSGMDGRIDALDVDEALRDLAQHFPRQAEVVTLRFRTGLDEREVATVLGVSTRTVRRRWRTARAFLAARLDGDGRGRPRSRSGRGCAEAVGPRPATRTLRASPT